MIAVLLPYLKALSPLWVAVSFAAGILTLLAVKRHRWAAAFTVLWLCLVYSSTVLSRIPTSNPRWVLTPLWSYSQWAQGDLQFRTFIVLNTLMLLPAGISLSFLWKDWRKVLLLGLGFSCLIELSQLVTRRGLFEIDDILHNTLGMGLGILIVYLLRAVRRLRSNSGTAGG